MAAAIQITFGIKPYLRYIETKRNHSDGPSRGFPIGIAPEWAQEKEADEIRKMKMMKGTSSKIAVCEG